MFDAGTVEAVAKVIGQSFETEVIRPKEEPYGVYYTRVPERDGELKRHVAVYGPRCYEVHRIEDLVDAIGLFGESAPKADRWFIMVGRGRVTAIANDGAEDPLGRHRLEVDLPTSQPFKFLGEIPDTQMSYPGVSQLEFIRVLRVTLGDVAPAELLEAMRMLRFSSADDGKSSVRTGHESLGRTVMRSASIGGVEGEGNVIPDEVTMSVNVYEDLDYERYRRSVRCVVEVTFGEQGPVFALIPVGGELKRAQDETDALVKVEIKKLLEQAHLEDISVVCGSDVCK